MKKAFGCIFIISLMIAGMSGCTGYSESKAYTENGVRYAIDPNGGKHALAMDYTWDLGMDPESLTINIPDVVCEDYKVTEFGGRTGIGAPELFEIRCDKDRHYRSLPLSDYLAFEGTDPDLYDYPVSFEKVVFTVNIGKNVKSIELRYKEDPEPVEIRSDDGTVEYGEAEGGNQQIAIEQEDGSVIWYEAVLYFNVAEENEYYYSEDGKLNKKP